MVLVLPLRVAGARGPRSAADDRMMADQARCSVGMRADLCNPGLATLPCDPGLVAAARDGNLAQLAP